MDNRPPPPPHGANSSSSQHTNPNAKSSSGLPPGNYDIFIVPPHSAGSGFLYLPSLQPHRNSFLAGVACTLAVVGIWVVVVPIIKQWISTVVASGGAGVLALIMGVGVTGWALGKTQTETESGNSPKASPDTGAGGTGPHPQPQAGHVPNPGTNGFKTGFTPGSTPFGAQPRSSWQQNGAGQSGATEGWAKAREETRKREEERRKKEETEKKAKEATEKDKWEKARARERESREKEAREKIIQERLRKGMEGNAEAAKTEAEAKAKVDATRASASPSKVSSGARAAAREAAGASPESKAYRRPVAQSYADDDEYSYRPYDTPKQPKPQGSNSSFVSTSSFASQSTARTTPPPSHRGPYSTKDPDKIQIKAVYAFNDLFPKPVAQLVAGIGNITDGLVLKMTTEGLFIDDDVRGVGQREWDVKAWTLKLIEVWCPQFSAKCGPSTPARYTLKQKEPAQRFWSSHSPGVKNLSAEELDLVLVDFLRTCRDSCDASLPALNGNKSDKSQNADHKGLHVLRACTRDANNKKYVFIVEASEAWKVAVGLQTLRRGSQVRSLGVSGMSTSECTKVLAGLGWI